jgi:heme/copper-type cytochrome/quinol oxidase subunit 2
MWMREITVTGVVAVVSSYTLTHAREIMGSGHIRPRDVSGESCLTVTNTLVPYILSLIYAVPRVYRLSPTHSCHIYRFSCLRCLVTTVCHQHTRVVSCVSYVWCLVSTVYPKHTRAVLSVSGSNSSNSSNQLQLIATDTPNKFNIASPPDSNETSSLTFL